MGGQEQLALWSTENLTSHRSGGRGRKKNGMLEGFLSPHSLSLASQLVPLLLFVPCPLPSAHHPPFALNNVSFMTSILSEVTKVALFSFLLEERGPGPLTYKDVRE